MYSGDMRHQTESRRRAPTWITDQVMKLMVSGVFVLHACGGSSPQQKGTTVARADSPEAIFVSADGGNPEHDQWRMEAAELWRQRNDPKALDQAIARWERLARESASTFESYAWLARAYHLQGQRLTSAAAIEAFEKGARAAETALEHAHGHDEQALEAEYWLLANRADASLRGDYMERVDHHRELTKAASRLVSRGSHADSDGARRILAALLASPPLFELRDLEGAKRLYEAVIAAHPEHLDSHLAYAAHYAVATQDLTLFKQQLESVLTAPATSVDDELSQRAAVELLKQAPYVFE